MELLSGGGGGYNTLVERKYATLARREEMMCLPFRHDCVAFQLLGLFLQRWRRLL